MLEMTPRFIIHPPPERFNSAKPLLDPSDEPHEICQNIQPGATTIDIFGYVKFQEKVRLNLGFVAP